MKKVIGHRLRYTLYFDKHTFFFVKKYRFKFELKLKRRVENQLNEYNSKDLKNVDIFFYFNEFFDQLMFKTNW
jgi:hypothetical protein